jgi:hypothetical protein
MLQSWNGRRARPGDDQEAVPDGERATGDAREERDALLRSLVPPIAFLQGDPAVGVHRVRHLQPHVPPGLLRRPGGGVQAAERGRHPVGRGRGADRPGQRPRCGCPDRPADVSRPDQVRGQAGEVHDRHRARRRDRERPGPAPSGAERLVDAARGLRRRPLRPRRCVAVRPRRRGDLPGRASAPGPGAAVREDPREARWPGDLRHQVLLVRSVRDRWHPGRDLQDGLDRDPGVRGEPPRWVARRRSLERDPGRGGRVRDQAHRTSRGPTDRGRDLQLRLRHADHGYTVPRDGAGTPRRGAAAGLHREGRARAAQG